MSAAQIHINRWSHSLIADAPQIHGCAQQNSAGVTIPHNSDFSWYTALSMALHQSCLVSTPLHRTRSPYRYSTPRLHGTPWMLTGLRSTDTNVADKNRYYTSIHHVSRADQNFAVLKRAENIMRHVEMWSVVRRKGTVRASRKMCTRVQSQNRASSSAG